MDLPDSQQAWGDPESQSKPWILTYWNAMAYGQIATSQNVTLTPNRPKTEHQQGRCVDQV